MAHRRELLEAWGFPYLQRGGVTLVARADAQACIERIYRENCRFYGYDAFSIAPDWIQPHLRWSNSWKEDEAPTPEALLKQLGSHPAEVTHYEFVFESAA